MAIATACTQPGGKPNSGVMQGGGVNKQDIGTVLGAVGGGVLGAQIGGGSGRTAAIIGGTLLGAALGNSMGASLDKADMTYYHQTSQQAMESGQPGQSFPWQNPQSGNSGVVIPSNYYQASNGQYCREYTQRVTVGGKTQEAYGTACRQPDGTWQVVN
jgi:surface antigen